MSEVNFGFKIRHVSVLRIAPACIKQLLPSSLFLEHRAEPKLLHLTMLFAIFIVSFQVVKSSSILHFVDLIQTAQMYVLASELGF